MNAPPPMTRHDRDSVTSSALRLLDEVGLPDLSMRRLAAELGVQPSALYWHFPNKQALLAAVADRILAPLPVPPVAADAEGALTAARAIRDALFSYRDGAEVVMSTFALGLGAGRAHDLLEDALRASLSPAAADRAATVVLQFILGHALLVQQRLHAESHGAAGPTDDDDPAGDLEGTFDDGVRAFLSGVLRAKTAAG